MRWIPIALMGVHRLIHLMGFAKGFGYADLPQLTQPKRPPTRYAAGTYAKPMITLRKWLGGPM